MTLTSAVLGRGLGLPPARTSAVRRDRDLGVPMGDGVWLRADRYYPVDDERAPLVLIRTPYGRGPMGFLARLLAERGYQVLVVSLRGTGGSGGRFTGWELASGDGPATLAWLRERDWFPGAMATWGASFPGYAQWELAREPIPEWKAAVIQDAPAEVRETFMYRGGVFALWDWLGWLQQMHAQNRSGGALSAALHLIPGMRRVRRAVQRLPLTETDRAVTGEHVDYFQQWLRQPGPGGYWSSTDHRDHVVNMPPIVHLAGGWQDPFLPGTLANHRALRDAGHEVRLLVGPWTHGRGLLTRAYMRDLFAVLDHALCGADTLPAAQVRVFVGGANRWSRLTAWPPDDYQPTPWYLRPDGGLATEGPPPSAPSRYHYDPADPTPSVGGPVLWGGAGVRDNRRLEARSDVLTFTGAPLRADLDVVGPVTAEIHVRSSLPHADVFVRLCDVTPRGRSGNVCDGIIRLTPEHPPAADGTRVARVHLWPTAHRFRRGHRVRLQVSGGAHPRFARNLGVDDQLGTAMAPVDLEVRHDPEHPSTVWLPVTTMTAPRKAGSRRPQK